MYPQWFRKLSLEDDRMRELYNSGFMFPLKERDQNGCRVVMMQANRLDTKKFTFSDFLKIINLIIFTLLEESETQIAGFVYIFDHKGISMDFVTLFSLIDLKNYLKCILNAIPCRQKQAIYINLPAFAVALTDFAKSFVSAKLKNRAYFYKGEDKLKDHIDVKILPREFGGHTPMEEMMDDFREKFNGVREKLMQLDQQHIDVTKVKDHESEAVGSFRKLEVD